MNSRILVVVILSGLVLGIVTLGVLIWPKQEVRRTSLAEHRLAVFKEAGFQMEIPKETPFVSGGAASVLVMVHEIKRGLQAEADYLIKVHLMRKSKEDMNDSLEFASQPLGDATQQWRYKIHSRFEVRKTASLWYVRKDIEIREGEFLSIDGEITVTEFIETDLSEIRRIIESIKLIPK